MSKEQDVTILDNMKRYGGGFVQALAEAAIKADGSNYAMLRNAFPHLWEQYGARFSQGPVDRLLEQLMDAYTSCLDEDSVFAQTYIKEQSTRAVLLRAARALHSAMILLDPQHKQDVPNRLK